MLDLFPSESILSAVVFNGGLEALRRTSLLVMIRIGLAVENMCELTALFIWFSSLPWQKSFVLQLVNHGKKGVKKDAFIAIPDWLSGNEVMHIIRQTLGNPKESAQFSHCLSWRILKSTKYLYALFQNQSNFFRIFPASAAAASDRVVVSHVPVAVVYSPEYFTLAGADPVVVVVVHIHFSPSFHMTNNELEEWNFATGPPPKATAAAAAAAAPSGNKDFLIRVQHGFQFSPNVLDKLQYSSLTTLSQNEVHYVVRWYTIKRLV